MPESQALRREARARLPDPRRSAAHDQAKAAAPPSHRAGWVAGPVRRPARLVRRPQLGRDPRPQRDAAGHHGCHRHDPLRPAHQPAGRDLRPCHQCSASTLARLTQLTEASGTPALADPQVIWDPDTSRFHYVVANFTTNTLMYGYSKTASPKATRAPTGASTTSTSATAPTSPTTRSSARRTTSC